MRDLKLRGVARARTKRTTIARKDSHGIADLVKRNFYADKPNQIWVADFTYVRTQEGWVYAAFIVDVFARRIVGHCVSTKMNKDMVARAFSIAIYNRIQQGLSELKSLVHHNDQGSQYTSDDFIELLSAHGIKASIGSVGNSYDNALAETTNGAYKAELIYNFGPWRSFEDVNIETERWVRWYNEKRINEYCDWQTPSEIEQLWYATGEDFRKGAKSER